MAARTIVALLGALAMWLVPSAALGRGGDAHPVGAQAPAPGDRTSFAPATASPATDSPVVYSIDGYAVVRQRLEAATSAHDAALEEGEPPRAAAAALREHVERAVSYLTEWIATETMPPALAHEAELHRYLLTENVVQLSIEAGDCDAAHDALARLRLLRRASFGADAAALIDSAARAASVCPEADAAPTPAHTLAADALAEPPAPRRERSQAWLVVPATLAAAAAIVGGAAVASRASYGEQLDRQRASWTVSRDASLDGARSRAQALGVATGALFGAGAASLSTGLVAAPRQR